MNGIQRSSFTVHRDSDPSRSHQLNITLIGEMSPLIRILDLWFRIQICSLQTSDHKLLFQGTRYLIGHKISTVYINDREQIHEPYTHPNITDIYSPYLIHMAELQVPQEVWTDILLLIQLTQVLLGYIA